MTRYTIEDLQLFVSKGVMAQAALEELPEYKQARQDVSDDVWHAIQLARRKRARPEQEIQRALCQWWAWTYPDSWAWTFHTPNGLAAKTRKLAAIFKGLGVKPGVPDLLCLQRRGLYTGMALELKDKKGNVTTNQRDWADRLVAQGYFVGIPRSIDEAMQYVVDFHTYAAAEHMAVTPARPMEKSTQP